MAQHVLVFVKSLIGSDPSPQMAAYSLLQLQFPGDPTHSSGFRGYQVHTQYTYRHAGKTIAQNY